MNKEQVETKMKQISAELSYIEGKSDRDEKDEKRMDSLIFDFQKLQR